MSAFAILERRAEARRENLAKSYNTLNEIAHKKEQQQYESYISNVNTLNQMKQIFTDIYPSLEEKERHESQETSMMNKSSAKTTGGSKRRKPSIAQKKR